MSNSRICGITIEVDGDTTKLTKALRSIDREVRNTQSSLRDVNKLLKLDPGNAELLTQKQKYLTDAIDATKKKLQEEKAALEQLKNAPQTEDTIRQQEALTREIADTEQSLKSLTEEYKSFGSVAGQQLQTACQKMQDVGDKISGAMENAKSVVSGVLDKIKGFFSGCKLEFPKIKLPHFSIEGKFSLDPPSVPKLSVSWYRKAMDDAYILNSPTIFGMAGGRYLGDGEAVSEAVVGTDKLAEIVRTAVASVSGGTTVIPVYIGQERIDEIVVRVERSQNFRSGGR